MIKAMKLRGLIARGFFQKTLLFDRFIRGLKVHGFRDLRIRFLAISLFITILILIYPSSSYASGSITIKPILLIPNNYKAEFSSIKVSNLATGVDSVINELRTFFKNQTKGITFGPNQPLTAIYSDYNSDVRNTHTTLDIYNQINGRGYLNLDQPDTLVIVWVIGSSNNVQYGGRNKDTNGAFAMFNHNDLYSLNSSEVKNRILGIMGHELAHAFGLEFSDYSGGHPCTQISIYTECTDKAKATGKYPPPEEYSEAILGTGHQYYPDTFLNNSLYNPEICKLYTLSYLNPRGLSCPVPIIDTSQPSPGGGGGGGALPGIQDIVPKEITSGGGFAIIGSGFGNVQGTVSLYFYEGNNNINYDYQMPPSMGGQVTSWQDDKITFRVNQPLDFDSRWWIRITNNDPASPYSSKTFGVPSSSYLLIVKAYQTDPYVLVNVNATCGTSNNPMPILDFYVQQNHSDGRATLRNNIYKEGQASYAFNLEYSGIMAPGDKFVATAQPVADIEPDPATKTQVILENAFPTGDQVKNITFHYPLCPTTLPPTGAKQIQQILVDGQPWDYLSGGFDLFLENYGIVPGRTQNIPIEVDYTDGSAPKRFVITFNYQPPDGVDGGGGGGSCGRSCVYTQDNACYQGNCLDGSQSCSFNSNCGFVAGCSSSAQVSCPGSGGGSCPDDITYCDNGRRIHKHGGYYDPSNSSADSNGCVYAFDDTGSCGGDGGGTPPSCNEDTHYCDGYHYIHKHGGYWDGSQCAYAFDDEGLKAGQCGVQSCNENTYYWDDNADGGNGACIHKSGGYFDEGNGECIYDFQTSDPSNCGR